LIAIVIIGGAFLFRTSERPTSSVKRLAVILALGLLLIAIQLIPLPPAVWVSLPGRAFVAEGFRLLEIDQPWLPISLTPYDTASTALTLLPPLAVLCAMLLTGVYRSRWIAVTMLGVSFGAVLLGSLQVGSPDPSNSPWYFYRRTNHGFATGFFANSNHLAAFLVVCVPILFALVQDLREGARKSAKERKTGPAILLLLAASAAVLLLGVALGGSLAVLLLGPPVLIVSTSLLFPKRKKLRRILCGSATLVAVGMLAIQFTPLHERFATGTSTSISVRQTMWSQTIEAIPDYMPLGSGVGSFRKLYPRYEDPASISQEFVSHAHNDYLEIALEAGLPGVAVLIAFIIWWASRARTIWQMPSPDPYAQAATIATAALLFHSFVEYPLRTAALSAVMAALLAVMARPREPAADAKTDLWPTRHARI
jgi:O-antigen ligase